MTATMKTALATLLALGLVTGAANARAPFDRINDAAPRAPFDRLNDAAPRAPFDRINDAAPRSIFDQIRDSAPRSDGVFGTLQNSAP